MYFLPFSRTELTKLVEREMDLWALKVSCLVLWFYGFIMSNNLMWIFEIQFTLFCTFRDQQVTEQVVL